jgi:hypothetical protein
MEREKRSGTRFVIPVILVGQITGVSGVIISIPGDRKLDDPAYALAQALNKLQIWTDVDLPPPYNNINENMITSNSIHIVIGTKP